MRWIIQQVRTKIATLGWHSGTGCGNSLKHFQISQKTSLRSKHPPFSNTYCFRFSCLDRDKENRQGTHLRFTLTLILFQDQRGEGVGVSAACGLRSLGRFCRGKCLLLITRELPFFPNHWLDASWSTPKIDGKACVRACVWYTCRVRSAV